MGTAHSFVVYIDEGGDDGIRNFRFTGDGGTSPWLVVGCCIVSKENDGKLPAWRNQILSAFPSKQKRDLHFQGLAHEQKLHVCREMARLHARYAVIMSNKTTIRNHPRPDLFQKKNTLYWYLCRYLVERVSVWCGRRARKGAPGNGTAKLVFSRRGGMDYDDFRAYLQRLKNNHNEDATQIDWSAIDIDSVVALDHSRSAGLQLADTPPSAFLRAVSPDRYGNVEPHYAKLLAPLMLRNEREQIFGTGVKPVPHLSQMSLTSSEREIFDFYIGQ
jgi:uncharacterized protein DUF3800